MAWRTFALDLYPSECLYLQGTYTADRVVPILKTEIVRLDYRPYIYIYIYIYIYAVRFSQSHEF